MTINETSPYSRSEYMLAWAVLAAGVGLAIIGNLLRWEQSFNWFGETLHFILPFAASLVGCMALYGKSLMGARSHPVPMVILVMLLGIGLGGLWEIGEWLYDQAFAHVELMSDRQDTMIDLTMSAAGALLAGILAVRMATR